MPKLLEMMNNTLAGVESIPGSADSDHAQVFLTGLPRSGTTYAYQLIADHLKVGYISNIVARFWSRPAFGAALHQALAESGVDRDFDYKSNGGNTIGVFNVHEFGYFWARHFHLSSREPDLRGFDDKIVDWDRLALDLSELANVFEAATVYKNIIFGQMAARLDQNIPAARFVIMHRDPVDVAASLLHLRQNMPPDRQTWVGIKPRNYGDYAGADLHTQIANQVRALDEGLTHACKKLPAEQILKIAYKDICRDPESALTSIARFIGIEDRRDPLRTDYPQVITQHSVVSKSSLDILSKFDRRSLEKSMVNAGY